MNMDRELKQDCRDINSALSALGGKYCCSILYLLANHGRSIRFNELKHSIGDVPCKTLSSTLKKMESEGLLQRTEYPQIPPRVEYSLTEKGHSLLPVLLAMSRWGALHPF